MALLWSLRVKQLGQQLNPICCRHSLLNLTPTKYMYIDILCTHPNSKIHKFGRWKHLQASDSIPNFSFVQIVCPNFDCEEQLHYIIAKPARHKSRRCPTQWKSSKCLAISRKFPSSFNKSCGKGPRRWAHAKLTRAAKLMRRRTECSSLDMWGSGMLKYERR